MSSQEIHFPWPPTRPPLEKCKTDLGIGIIGYGRIIRAMHMPAYQTAGYRVVAAADPDPKARELAQLAHIPRVVADYRELLKMDEVQVVDVAINHKTPEARLEVIRAAAEAGKPVLLQKPIAETLEAAQAMVETMEKAGVAFAINQNARYGAACYAVRQLLSPERLGKAGALEIENIVRAPRAGSQLVFGPQGADIAWYVHHVDLLRWWADSEPVRVYAQFAQGASMVLFEFASGASAYMMEIGSHSLENETPIRIWAEKGALRANHRWNPWSNWPREFVQFRSADWPPTLGWMTLNLPGDPGNPYGGPNRFNINSPLSGMIGVMGDFMEAVAQGRPAPTNARDNLLTLRMCLAAQRSAQTKQPVDPREL